MEAFTLERIKKRAGALFEPALQTGRVLEVRHWEPSTFMEVDLHLPQADMSAWTEIPYIKFKVADLTFRDYTPSGWDAETHTCTLFIDVAHNGPGCKWASQLKKSDIVSYYKIKSTQHAPEETPAVIGLGDESSIGHLLALQQMVVPATRFSGAVLIHNASHRDQFNEYFRSPLTPIPVQDAYGHNSLMQWIIEQQYTLDNTVFYITGNQTMVIQLRKLLKMQGYHSTQVKAQSFWK
ncbi:SIP domain-containing protein [Mucilaginibacter sp. X4EP1]|uniref:SIP domain-containing protein n=1 Tax=Mucilaginibacter sp. X4EP1 TaxID=2723092 RepID=UPI00216A1304|nr:SIP domain-containing protein [Mucilaginibacter sp. X4EP1]MCS3816393.1 NADPH-dependent ferric siderophore reductase [Mucilaginibacter sp. X4EP1]